MCVRGWWTGGGGGGGGVRCEEPAVCVTGCVEGETKHVTKLEGVDREGIGGQRGVGVCVGVRVWKEGEGCGRVR